MPDPPIVAVVVNADKQDAAGELNDELQALGALVRWRSTSDVTEADAAARAAVAEGADVVVAAGGDGTVRSLLAALAHTSTALAIAPVGTTNSLASALGIPSSAADAAAVAVQGTNRRLDLGWLDDHAFALAAGAGFDAAVMQQTDAASKKRLGRSAFMVKARKVVRRPRTRVRVDIDGRTVFERGATNVVIGNVATRSRGLIEVFPDAVPDDGLLDVAVMEAKGVWQWLAVTARQLARRSKGDPRVRHVQGASIDVRWTVPQPVQVDGDSVEPRSLFHVRVDPGALEVRVPS